MADNRQFGSPKGSRTPQFGDKISPGGASSESQHCAECEAMLTDAIDGTLSVADQATFDAHTAHCGPCAQMLADAQRGIAWLEMLREPRPEPPAALLERILSQTSGVQPAGIHLMPSSQPAELAPATVLGQPTPAYATSNVIPFRTRFASAVRSNSIGHLMLQPRLAMTAAMAFFSIALTMNLTGVHLQDFRVSDLRPTTIKRNFYSANARVVQYYEGLRVVYELESRVHDLQSGALQNGSDNDAPAGTQTTPRATPDSGTPTPDTKPAPADQSPQPERKKSAPSPGTSRRERLSESRLQLATLRSDENLGSTVHATSEGRTA